MKTADMSAFFKIGYGLYVVTSPDGTHDNGMICNTVVQVAGEPARGARRLACCCSRWSSNWLLDCR